MDESEGNLNRGFSMKNYPDFFSQIIPALANKNKIPDTNTQKNEVEGILYLLLLYLKLQLQVTKVTAIYTG